MGACQARRRPAKERRRSPTVIINLRPGHLREPGQPRPCRLPFYVPVLSTAENGAHGSIEARMEAPILAGPGSPRRSPSERKARGWSPGGWRSGVRGCGQEDAHAHGRVHNHTRALGHFQSRARTDCKRRAAWWVQPETLGLRAFLLPKDFKVLMLSPCRATFLKLWVSYGRKKICFGF